MNYCEKCKRDLPDGEKCHVCTPKKGVFIEMEMPKSCLECKFFNGTELLAGTCFLKPELGRIVVAEGRHPLCPLQEVKEDK